MTTQTITDQTAVEPFITLAEAAKALRLPYFKLQRVARHGAFRTYSISNRRILVRLSEVVEAIESSSQGGNR